MLLYILMSPILPAQLSGDSGFESRAGFFAPSNQSTRWPNGKAPDYGALFAAGDGSLARILYFREVSSLGHSLLFI